MKVLLYICKYTFIYYGMNDIINKLGYLSGGSRLRRIYEKLQVGGDKVYKDAGVNFKSSWFPVFFVLSISDKPQTVMGITDQISFSHITVKNIVQELYKEKLVNIVSNPSDKRSKHISLTNEGVILIKQLEPLWLSFSNVLKKILTTGHPDIINILGRIDSELTSNPLNKQINNLKEESVIILDYNPGLKAYFFELAGYWLTGFLKGKLDDEEEFALRNPEKTYLEQGGFLFFAKYKEEIVGCIALKPLDDYQFELVNLFVEPAYRNMGIATRLIDRCITRCYENQATELWLQTNISLKEADKLYYKFNFKVGVAPKSMNILPGTEKVMCKEI